MASLVVPATSLTMALSSFNKALIKLLFPTFGLPIIQNLGIWLFEDSLLGISLVISSNNSLKPILCSPLTPITLSNPNS